MLHNINELLQTELWTKEEEAFVLRYYQATKDKRVVEKILNMHSPMIYEFAVKYANENITVEDLYQEGFLGLLKAMELFDPQYGAKFITYGAYWIRQRMSRYVLTHTHMISLPVYIMSFTHKIAECKKVYERERSDMPFTIFLSKSLEVDVEKTEEILKALNTARVLSYNLEVENPDKSLNIAKSQLVSVIQSNEDVCLEVAERLDNQDFLAEVKRILNQREWKVISMHYGIETGEPVSYTKCGKEIGLSREAARKIELKAFQRLRNYRSIKRFYNF